LFSINHRIVGLWYFGAATFFLLVGFLLMLLMRWQLAWPTSPLPPSLAAFVGDMNAPGGYMAPEFYNQLVAMHGTVMIFLAVVPLLTGAFGNYLVPGHIGARTLAFPRLSALSFWIFLAAGVLMLLGFFVEGGAANSGWTSYPPLAVIATRGQSLWLVGIFLLGVSAMLNAINIITTIVQLRAPGMALMRLPFFVWAQLVAALLLLLAFPALQAAGLLQLLDRIVGTSFFMPTGLIVSGIPLEGYSGGGNPLLWQHLFWFLGHPEVYVLILPAIGIVAEIISAHTGRPLWGYRGMVASVLFLGAMSMIVWAHHMFLTGMGTSLGTFFQITTMIISIPSVVLITSLVLSLWGGSIRFTPPMLFALAFLPMFGIGGLSGLPLGLAASDVILHDTWYVVGHFHFLVAPGTVFAIFAGIYFWFPAVTGRALHHRLGQVHFWGSLITMTGIFLPMFTLGLRGVNRRLYDAGMQYAHAQGTLGIQEHMTWMAVALGVAQLPFILNIVITLRRPRRPDEELVIADVESAVGGGREAALGSAIPYAYAPRDDSRVTNVRLGTWLFLASEAMFFGSLFSAYVLLRTGASSWPPMDQWLGAGEALLLTTLLAAAPLALLLRRAKSLSRDGPVQAPGAMPLWLSTFAGLAFVTILWWLLWWRYTANVARGLHPADNIAAACWMVLTGALALHVAGGVMASVWTALAGRQPFEDTRAAGVARSAAASGERLRALTLYWLFLNLVWIASVVSFSL
jgi:cytochrome c oxidase subunit 1